MKTIAFTVYCFLFCSYVHAQYHEPGTLDSTFGTNGTVELKPSQECRAHGVVIQPDGKIISVGIAEGLLAITRCNPDGSLDKTFSNDGIDTLSTFYGRASAVALQADGKILMFGHNNSSLQHNFIVARYNSNGTKDISFNSTGIAVTQLPALAESHAIAVQPDGKILAAGRCAGTVAIVRYNSDGTLDNTFNDSGKVFHSYSYTEATGILVQSDGKILITGTVDSGTSAISQDFLLIRYKPNGRRDSSFGTNGVVTADFGGGGESTRSVLLPDGKIIMAGTSFGNFTIIKCNNDGTLDNSFGTIGKAIFDAGGDDDATAMTVQSDGKIVLGGFSDKQFALARFNPDGSIDKTFGINGIAKTILGTNDNRIHDIALQQDGKIIAVGYSQYPPTPPYLTSYFTLLRFNGRWASEIHEIYKTTDITIYPNPVSDMLHITGDDKGQMLKAQIITSDGRIIHEISNSLETISLKDIPAGFYLVRLFMHGGGFLNKPLIIQP